MSTNVPISPPIRKKQISLPQSPSKPLKVMTWNVAALRTIPSKLGTTEFQNKVPMNNVLSAFFKKYNVDIACIQEHKFSGWDKLDKEYAIIDGSSIFECTKDKDTIHSPEVDMPVL
jgi:mRNA deadenylase 3'-5' endonuclease subunit Ccr4